MANETMLEILTGGIPLEIGLDYLWEIYVHDYRDNSNTYKNQKCKLIELTEENLIVFDYKDRQRYTHDLKSVISHHIKINPKPLNAKIETKTVSIDQLIRDLYNLSGNMVFLEDYSHDNAVCWKILNPFTRFVSDTLVLCKMDDGIEKALNVAIVEIRKRRLEFFGKEN